MTIIIIADTEKILKGLEKIAIGPKKYCENMTKMNDAMAEVHRDYKFKEANSEHSAAECYFTA